MWYGECVPVSRERRTSVGAIFPGRVTACVNPASDFDLLLEIALARLGCPAMSHDDLYLCAPSYLVRTWGEEVMVRKGD